MNKVFTFFILGLLFLVYAKEPEQKPKHQVEEIVFNFIKDLKNDVYAENIYYFEADTELTKEEREYYFRRLEKYVRNNTWSLYFTIIDIYNGHEDMADVILKAKSGDLVVFCLGFWYDVNRWELDAYEFPALTFDRPEDQSYEDYVQQIIDDAKAVGVEYSKRETIKKQGTYYIEYK
ncbi:MAG TPA: hypothetical protein ENI34_05390 [candidate division WOR-3 bacterium]|uniref:Uncharacterized protein n=1 Tax=candidate division WOR-3 bacterium TaxID=2052148 RepID=A0A9C9ELX0_UNCW3|nr:hypothetical protein [candidate division WOR-3 bacterium]